MRLFGVCAVLLLLALAVLSAGDLPPSAPTEAAGETQGDVDCTGAADSIDALKVLLAVSGLPYTADCLDEAGDVDCSGERDSIDALRILGFVAGLPFTPPAGCTPIGEPLEGGATPSPTPDPDAPTGEQLIEAALGAGDIDQDTAVLYKAYWAFDDPRLPEQFEGAARRAHIPDEIWLRPDGLSPETEAELNRYLIPPSNPDSWYYNLGESGGTAAVPLGPSPSVTPAGSGSPTPTPVHTPPTPVGTWMSITSGSGRVKVWWDNKRPEDEAKAEAVADEVDEVWDKHQSLLGIQPIGDGTIPVQYNGGDATYDIYIVPLRSGLYGGVARYHPITASTVPCPASMGFMVLNRGNSAVNQSGTLAHELFHSFQTARSFADNCLANSWITEATATWAEDYVYPQLNTEHTFDWFRPNHAFSMPKWDRGYAAWVFFFFLARTGSPSVIADILSAAQTQPGLNAIDGAIDGGFEKQWPEFARYGWNHPPADQFSQWDDIITRPWYRNLTDPIPAGSNLPTYLTLGVNDAREEYSATALNKVSALAIDYYRLSLALEGPVFQDPALLTVNNPWGVTPAHAALQMAYRIGDEWQIIDLSGETSISFCRTNPDERVEELVLIVSNSAPPPGNATPDFTKPVAAVASACGWHGEAKVTWLRDGGAGAATETLVTGTATDLLFVPGEAPAGAAATSSGATYKLVGGTLTWTYQPIEGFDGCTYTAEPLTVQLVEGDGEILEAPSTTAGNSDLRLLGLKTGQLTILRQCPDGNNTSSQFQLNFSWLCGEGTVGPDTTSVDGMEHYFTTQEPQTPIECPVQASSAQDNGGVHTQDFASQTVDWEFHLEK